MGLKSIDAKQVAVIVGTRALKGFADGSFVTVARAEDSWSKHVGSDGEVTRARSNDKTGTIEIVLARSSEDNAYLQQLVNTDENTGNGVVPATVLDKKGTYKALSTQSWIQKPADAEFGKETTERTWTIVCADLTVTGGGN